jgi:hypothetical protein
MTSPEVITTESQVEQFSEQILALLGVDRQSLKLAASAAAPVPANQIASPDQLSSLLRDLLVDFIGMEVRTP